MGKSLEVTKKKISSREFTILSTYLDYGVYFKKDKGHQYLAQIAQIVALVNSKKPESVHLGDFELTIDEEGGLTPEQRMLNSKMAWAGFLGIELEDLTSGNSSGDIDSSTDD